MVWCFQASGGSRLGRASGPRAPTKKGPGSEAAAQTILFNEAHRGCNTSGEHLVQPQSRWCLQRTSRGPQPLSPVSFLKEPAGVRVGRS